jgi:peptidoglycan L-alanyl-D-glutamate endopeptidase CwlK
MSGPYRFGSTSENRLTTCHLALQSILRRAIEIMDFSVVCGHRSPEAQAEAYRAGLSKLKPGQSKHNAFPARAVDLAPYYPGEGIRWNDPQAFCLLAGIIRAIAHQQGVKIRWGGDWDGDNDRADQTFDDLGHFELADD